MNALTIGKLAASGGVGVETIRFYQRKGPASWPMRASKRSTRRSGSFRKRAVR